MLNTLISLIDRLDTDIISNTDVIQWGMPVPSFGNINKSKIATLGLNPSNREFVDEMGNELQGRNRRFHTLKSLGIKDWSEIDYRHLSLLSTSCENYFNNNPYDRWFKVLDRIISGINASYYGSEANACHLDLIPYATKCKWNELSINQRLTLIDITENSLGLLVRDSPIKLILLNGRSVVNLFQESTKISLQSTIMPDWSLPRQATRDVTGIAYFGVVDSLSGVQLGRHLLVLGFNHNLQSSFGVTSLVLDRIQKWVSIIAKEYDL